MRVSVFVEQMECVIYFMLLPYKNTSTIHSDPFLEDDEGSWKILSAKWNGIEEWNERQN